MSINFINPIQSQPVQELKPNFSIGSNFKPRVWVVDDFYDDPMAVREYALKLDYVESDYHRGKRTEQQHIFPGTKEAFERVMGKPITKWSETYGMCGRFQHCTSEDALVYHYDIQTLAAIIYLTPNAPFLTGTSLIAHKKTKIRHLSDPNINDAFMDNGVRYHLDGTPFEPVDIIGNVFNRLIIFDAQCIHQATQYFGTNKYNSRLFHIFFFD
jgi:hypothetical protein